MSLLREIAVSIVDVTLTFAWTFPITIALEFLFPHKNKQPLARLQGAAIWAIYFVLTGVILVAEAKAIAAIPLEPLVSIEFPRTNVFFIICGTVFFFVVVDFLYYWAHRAQHSRYLWRFHAVHHGIRDLNAVNSYHHWTEELTRLPFIGLPLAYLIHLDILQSNVAAAIIVLHSGYVHSACRIHFPQFMLLGIADNRFHRIHHSIEEKHFDKNFSVFTTIWDRMFGTAYFPEKDEWPATGVKGMAEIDSVTGFLLAKPKAESVLDDLDLTGAHKIEAVSESATTC